MSAKAIKWAFDVSTQHGLNQTNRLVLLAIAYHHHPKTGDCYPELETIAAYAGLSVRRARSAARAIAATGLIRIRPRYVGGHQRSNQYDLFRKFRADASVRVKTGFRADGGGTPEKLAGRTHASPDKVIIYIPEPDDENLAPFSLAKGCEFSGGAK